MCHTESHVFVLVGLLLLWPALGACAPQTQYRRTALVAAPVSETLIRQPRGDVQVLGSVEGGLQDTDDYPEVGDPSVLRPTLWTSGELRLSNFLLWSGAYAELMFMDLWWPDFTRESLEKAIDAYRRRDRRFGGLGA